MSSNVTIPAPISWLPTSHWDGNDGLWNSFEVRVGSQLQSFRVLPSTSGEELLLPDPLGCTTVSPSNPGYCGYLRGALPLNGVNISGYYTNLSTSWRETGTFTLSADEGVLGLGGNAEYGQETVIWGNLSTSPDLTSQVVALTADVKDWWFGSVGINPQPINFSTFNDPQPSYLETLASKGLIPCRGWAYTAGAAYRDRAPASLTLGGYDTNRFDSGGALVQPMNPDNSRPLTIGIPQIHAQNTLTGDPTLYGGGDYFVLDSTTPFIWMPEAAIPAWVSSFGLEYDSSTDLFLVNDTTRAKLQALNSTITLFMSRSPVPSNETLLGITFPYAAFDLQASYPYYQKPTNYFPIRSAANSSQYFIGRTFFQEAYVIADFDRQSFSVAQAAFPSNYSDRSINPILSPDAFLSPNATNSTPTGDQSHLKAGAIFGIAAGVGIFVVIIIVGAMCFFTRRSLRRRASDNEKSSDNVVRGQIAANVELSTDEAVHEAPNTGLPAEAPGNPFAEHYQPTDKSFGVAMRTSMLPSSAATSTRSFPVSSPYIGTPISGGYPSPTLSSDALTDGHRSSLRSGAVLVEAPGDEAKRHELEDRRRFSFERGSD